MFVLCVASSPIVLKEATRDPCVPSPCGLNAQCRVINQQASCSCLSNYFGSPPNCRPECTINADCSSNLACMNEKCRDPCPGACGVSALCSVVAHTPICSCPSGYMGDPFTACTPKPLQEPPSNRNPSNTITKKRILMFFSLIS